MTCATQPGKGGSERVQPIERQSFRHAARLLVWVLGLVSFVPGCWDGAPPGRVTAYGVVKFDGQPVPDGALGFEAVEDGVGVAAAKIGAGGRFKVFLRPATYRIGVVSVEGGLSPAGFSGVDAAKIRVPAKYAIPGRSGIEVKIDAKNRKVLLDLKP